MSKAMIMDEVKPGQETLEEEDIEKPRDFKVLLHNDDVTTMDFVVEILRVIFNKSSEDAESIMLKIHNTGIGLCGVYTEEIAESKVSQVTFEARRAGFPLKCTMEED